MPYAKSNGYNIYYETEGHGPPLLLHHGLTISIEDWRDIGYVERLERDHKLILTVVWQQRLLGGLERRHQGLVIILNDGIP